MLKVKIVSGFFTTLLALFLSVNFAFAGVNDDLIDAAKNGDIQQVKEAISKGANVNAREDNLGATALMCAALNDHKDIVELLISKGADVNAKDDKFGATALMWAAKEGHKDIVELLISKGANVNAKGKFGITALTWAAQEGYKDIVELLISKGADVNAKDKSGATALMHAAKEGHKDIVELLKHPEKANSNKYFFFIYLKNGNCRKFDNIKISKNSVEAYIHLPTGSSSVNYSKNKILWIVGSDYKSYFENGKLTKETKNKILNECGIGK